MGRTIYCLVLALLAVNLKIKPMEEVKYKAHNSNQLVQVKERQEEVEKETQYISNNYDHRMKKRPSKEPICNKIEEADREPICNKTEQVDKAPIFNKAEEVETGPISDKTEEVDKVPISDKTEEADKGPISDKTEEVDKASTSDKTEEVDKGPISDKTEEIDKVPISDKTEEADIVPIYDQTNVTTGMSISIKTDELPINPTLSEIDRGTKNPLGPEQSVTTGDYYLQEESMDKLVEKEEENNKENESQEIDKGQQAQQSQEEAKLEEQETLHEEEKKNEEDKSGDKGKQNDTVEQGVSSGSLIEDIKNNKYWALQQDEVIKGDFELNISGELDLAGHTLKIKGDLYHISGKINVNGGTLIVNGNYHLDNIQAGTSGDGRLILNQENDYVYVDGNMTVYSSWGVGDYWKNGILHLRGNLECCSMQDRVAFKLSANSKLKIILDGQGAQCIKIKGSEAFFTDIFIEGNPSRQVEIQFESKTASKYQYPMVIRNITNNVNAKLKLDEGIRVEKIVLNEDLDIGSRCMANNINLNSYKLIVEEDLTLKNSLILDKGQVFVKGSMELSTATDIKMRQKEDLLQIEKDLYINNCGSLTLESGQLMIGGNIKQKGTKAFITREDLKVILLGSQGQEITISGKNIILQCVILVNEEASYEFSEGVLWNKSTVS